MQIDLNSIRLRNLARSDGPAIRSALRDGQVARNLESVPYPFHKCAEYELIERVSQKGALAIVGYVFGIERFIGVAGMHKPNNPNNAVDLQIGFWVAQPFWGQGVGTRAIEILIASAPTDARIGASVLNDNSASMRVFEKLGFKKYGESTCQSMARDEPIGSTRFGLNLRD